MKVIKLHKRNIGYKHGFTHALKFDNWCGNAAKAEDILAKTHKTACYDKKGAYYGYFGRVPKKKYDSHDRMAEKPYWINLRYEADITLLLLNGVKIVDHTD